MKKPKNYFSILNAKANQRTPQKFFCVVSPVDDWISNTPHHFDGEVEISGYVCYDFNKVRVSGSLVVPLQFICDRCATKFRRNLMAQFDVYYDEIDEFDNFSDIEIEYKIVSNKINLLPLVRDSILENISSTALCNENCKGLCPICGENLNLSSCKCKI